MAQEEGSPTSSAGNTDNPLPLKTQPVNLVAGSMQDKECSLPLNQVQKEANTSSSKDKKGGAVDPDEILRAKGKRHDAYGNEKELLTFVPDSNDLELDISEGNMEDSNADRLVSKSLPRLSPQISKPDASRKKGHASALPHDKAAAKAAEVIDISDDDIAGARFKDPGSQQEDSESDGEVQTVNPPADAKGKAAQPKEQLKKALVIQTNHPMQPADADARDDSNPTKQKAAAKKKGKKAAGRKAQPAKVEAPRRGPATRRQVRAGKGAVGKTLANKAATIASKAAKEATPDWLTDNAAASVSYLLLLLLGWSMKIWPSFVLAINIL